MLSPRTRTPTARKLWGIIEMLRFRRDMSDTDLAGIARTTVRTVSRDKTDPMKMPLERFFRYIGIGLTESEIIAAIEKAIAEKEQMIER